MHRPTKRGALLDRLRWIAAALAALTAAAGAVFVIGMRIKSPLVQKAVRRVNRAYWNPRAMETAGTPGAYASVIHHVGRRSGTTYHTPVVPIEIGDGFAIALPYGEQADWVQNVLAAGEAVVTADGETVAVDQPQIVPIAEVADQLPPSEQRLLKLFNVDQLLRVRRVDQGSPP